jgi:hypothetical protein
MTITKPQLTGRDRGSSPTTERQMHSYLPIVLAASLLACGSEVARESIDDPGARPPSPPEDAPYGEGSGQVFAIDTISLGEVDSEWKRFGYNLDGLLSEGGEKDHCRTLANVNPKVVHADGVAGIDNGFGASVLYVLTTLIAAPSGGMSASIAAGQSTLLLDLDGLGSGPSYLGLAGHLNFGLALGAPAAFDGSDVWPIDQALLENASDPRSTIYSFPDAYVNDHVWVSGPPASFTIQLPAPLPLRLSLERAVITMKLAPDRSRAHDGIIAGVLPLDAFTDELLRVLLANEDAAWWLCDSPSVEALREHIRQVADMPRSGVHDPDALCDALSIGIGFSATVAQLGPAAVAPPPAESCDPGG